MVVKLPIQPTLITPLAVLVPLDANDFEELYAVASDPAIWEQHPNRDRWQKDAFSIYFEGALESGGAFKIIDPQTGALMGSTRYYDNDAVANSILIGYTFYATRYWGMGVNPMVKKAMLDHIFPFVSAVYFHVGSCNLRSQIAMERLGAQWIGEQDVAYFGEQVKKNVVFRIRREEWEITIR